MNQEPAIQQVLERIERDARNEFDQLAEIGADFFSTAELLRLHGKWEEASQTFQTLQKTLIIIGATSPAWVLLALPAGLLGYLRMAFFIMGFFPVTFFIFAAGVYFLKKKYVSKGYLDFIGSLISEELKRRNLERQAPRRRRD